MYEYRCKILRVVDGDTVDVDIDLGFGMWMHKERVRMMGIDTPESRTRDKVEKKFGLASKQFVKDMMPVGSKQVLKTQIDGKKLTETIIKEGYGVVYTGQNKDQVEKAHLNNRKKLIKEGKVTL
jgi:micrococcal nuclease